MKVWSALSLNKLRPRINNISDLQSSNIDKHYITKQKGAEKHIKIDTMTKQKLKSIIDPPVCLLHTQEIVKKQLTKSVNALLSLQEQYFLYKQLLLCYC